MPGWQQLSCPTRRRHAVNSNGVSWNVDMVTTTGNVVIDLLHNFHLECGAHPQAAASTRR